MQITIKELNQIVKTLPIGLYIGRKIGVSTSEDAETSYYSPSEDSIVISLPIINKGLKNLKKAEENSAEKAVRAMVYHEVSHAFLTPNIDYIGRAPMMNIFEDERIETLLANYYLMVDFKENVRLINNYHGQAPTCAEEKFYHAVRFRATTPEINDEINRIIYKYRNLLIDLTNASYARSYDYYTEVEELYRKITGESPKYGKPLSTFSKPYPDSSEMTEKEKKTLENSKDNCAKSCKKSAESVKGGKPSGTMEEEIISAEEEENGASEKKELSAEEKALNAEMKKIIDNNLSRESFVDKKVYSTMRDIILSFNKMTGGGSAEKAYSGRINPRSIGREDWRIFDRMNVQHAENKYGSLHLNLFIDNSGSFSRNDGVTNKIIQALIQIEKEYPHFTFDIATMNMHNVIIDDKKDFVFRSSGGNDLNKSIYKIYHKLQKPNTLNYNIVLFDGDCYSDSTRETRAENPLKIFNNRSCTVITDNQNERYLKSIEGIKVIYTKDYVAELSENIIKTLSTSFR